MTSQSQPTHQLLFRPVAPRDREVWTRLRTALYGESEAEELRDEVERYFAGTNPEPQEVLLAEDEEGRVLGMVELAVRPFAEGCRTQRVAYLEGWYVMPEARRSGVGRALVAAAEAWGRDQGCEELASDAKVDNEVSRLAHTASGFEDVGLVRCFRKDL